MVLDRAAAEPLWVQVREALRAEIASGSYAVGDRLAVEPTLAERFGVNRLTVRQAVADLAREGLLLVRQGSGTYVAAPDELISVELKPAVWDESTWRMGGSRSSLGPGIQDQLLDVRRVAPPPAIFDELRKPDVLWIESVVGDDAGPAIRSQIWAVTDWTPTRLRREYGRTLSATRLQELVGSTLHYSWRAFDAVAATPRDAEILKVPAETPLLRRFGVNVGDAGRPAMYVQRDALGSRMRILLRNGRSD